MKVGVWQTAGEPGGIDANLARLAGVLREAAAAGVGLLVTPELWTTGYADAAAIRAGSEPADGPGFVAIAALARKFGVAIVYGYPEQAGADRYNSAQLVGRDGVSLLNHHKLHLWGDHERRLFTPGPAPGPPVGLDGWQVAISICYDTEFPELIRRYAVEGAELVVSPTALSAGVAAIPDLIVPVRALENGIYIAFCNRCGSEGALAYHGASCIVDPGGAKLGTAGAGEALVVATLDKAAIAAARARAPFLADRRADLY